MRNLFRSLAHAMLFGGWCGPAAAVLSETIHRSTLGDLDDCSTDNWGMPSQGRRPFTTNYETEIRAKCGEQLSSGISMADTFQDAMVNWYETAERMGKFDGDEWVPENHELFAGYPTRWKSGLNPNKVKPGTMKGGVCEAENDDGSRWTVNRIGPFVTTGGYDWVQVGWEDIWGLEEKLKAYKDGIFVTAQYSAAVTRDGSPLSHPPIHIHHIHVGPRPGVRQHTDQYKCVKGGGVGPGCYDPTRVFEHHGDYQCLQEAGGLDCLLETVPDGYGKLLTFPLGIEGDINDVRAPGSEPLEWYYEIAIRWVPKDSSEGAQLKPMHFHNFAGPGTLDLANQNTYIFTYQCPTDHDSLFWYSGRMPYTGQMLRNKFHAHNKIFKEGLFFAASPEELGLTKENGLKPVQPYETVDLRNTRFNSLEDVKAFLFKQMEQSGREFDERNGVGGTGEIDLETQFSRERPRAVCHGVSTLEKVDGYFYDRKEDTCCRPWHIEKGDIFTVIGFNKKLEYSPGPHLDKYPPTFPGHVGWWLSVASEEPTPKSFFSIAMYNQEPNSFPHNIGIDIVDPLTRLAIVENGGTIPGSVSFMRYPRAYIINYTVNTCIHHPAVVAAVLALLVIKCIHSCLLSRWNRKVADGSFKYKPVSSSSISGLGRRSTGTCPDPDEVLDRVTSVVTSTSEVELREALGKAH